MVRTTAILPHASGMLPPMEIRLETPKSLSQLAGFDWSDAELEAVRPAVARTLHLLARLETLPLASVEPTRQYPELADAGPRVARRHRTPAHAPSRGRPR